MLDRIQALLRWKQGISGYGPGLDLGNGRTLTPEDVLDGHGARLLARRQPQTRTVPVQLHDLAAAITVMAPDLAPLADLAEEVAVAVPAVAPEPGFRRNLHDALERTHRQQYVQEMLGTAQTAGNSANRTLIALAIAAVIVSSVPFFAWYTFRRAGHARFCASS